MPWKQACRTHHWNKLLNWNKLTVHSKQTFSLYKAAVFPTSVSDKDKQNLTRHSTEPLTLNFLFEKIMLLVHQSNFAQHLHSITSTEYLNSYELTKGQFSSPKGQQPKFS